MILLIDFSNVVYSSIFSCMASEVPPIKNPEDCPPNYTDYLLTFQQKTEDLLHTIFPYDATIREYYFVIDDRPVEKHRLFPEYKAKRKRNGGFRFDPKRRAMEMLAHWGAKIIYSEYQEADDAISSYIGSNPDEKFVVATTDKDLWQLCQLDNVRIFNFHNKNKEKRYVTSDQLDDAFVDSKTNRQALEDAGLKFHYSHIALYKTLWGDSSDNIPNLIQRQKKVLLPIIAQTDGTYESFQKKIRENWFKVTAKNKPIITDTCKNLLVEFKEQLKLFYQIVNLKYACPVVCEVMTQATIDAHAERAKIAKELEAIPW